MPSDELTTVRIVEPTAAVEAGEHTGEIVDTYTNTYDADNNWAEVEDPDEAGDPVSYFGVEVSIDGADDFTLRESWSLNKGNIHENTGLGAELISMGIDLETMREEELSLLDVFAEGKQVRFQVNEEEYEDDEGQTQTRNTIEQLTPIDGEVDVDSGNGGSEADQQGAIYSVIGEMDDPQEAEVLKTLAQTDGTLVPVFKQMVEDGEITIEEGAVSL